jgi:hypothetical protein
MERFVGIDVSKAALDVHVVPDGVAFHVARMANSVQNFPDSGGKQRPIVATPNHAIIRLFGRRIWGVAHGLDCRDPAPSFGEQGEHQFDRA